MLMVLSTSMMYAKLC